MLCAVCCTGDSHSLFSLFFSGKFFVNLGVHEGKDFLKLDLMLWQMLNSYSEICGLAFCGTWLQQSVYSL